MSDAVPQSTYTPVWHCGGKWRFLCVDKVSYNSYRLFKRYIVLELLVSRNSAQAVQCAT